MSIERFIVLHFFQNLLQESQVKLQRQHCWGMMGQTFKGRSTGLPHVLSPNGKHVVMHCRRRRPMFLPQWMMVRVHLKLFWHPPSLSSTCSIRTNSLVWYIHWIKIRMSSQWNQMGRTFTSMLIFDVLFVWFSVQIFNPAQAVLDHVGPVLEQN